MATAPKKATTPKAPQDRKPKAEKQLSPEETPGWELMRDMNEIPVWEQTDLVAILQDAFEDEEADDNGKRSFDITIIGRLGKALQDYAKDEKEYLKFASGPGAMERVMNLSMAWVGQMGEFSSSAT